MLPRRHRLTERADFTAVLRSPGSRRRGHRLLVVHVRPAGAEDVSRPSRVGLVVSGAVGGSVTRHAVARRLRHQLQPLMSGLPTGTDVVIRANPAAADATSAELGAALRRGLRDVVEP